MFNELVPVTVAHYSDVYSQPSWMWLQKKNWWKMYNEDSRTISKEVKCKLQYQGTLVSHCFSKDVMFWTDETKLKLFGKARRKKGLSRHKQNDQKRSQSHKYGKEIDYKQDIAVFWGCHSSRWLFSHRVFDVSEIIIQQWEWSCTRSLRESLKVLR